MNGIVAYIQSHVKDALRKAYPDLQDTSIIIEFSKNIRHGDFSTPIAMNLSRILKQPSRLIAENLAVHITGFQDVQIAGNGFINITLTQEQLVSVLKIISQQGKRYGYNDMLCGQRINVEYASCNPTGPIHIGHARGAVVGDVIASVLTACGANVCREYYVNDYGEQMQKLARSSFLRYQEALGISIVIPSGVYPGEYLKEVGIALAQEYGTRLLNMNDDLRWSIITKKAVSMMMSNIRRTLKNLGIIHDVFSSEKDIVESGFIDCAIQKLQPYLYYGTLDKPMGKAEDWESKEHLLFRSTEFEDDQDRVLKKANGQWTYFAGDVGYHMQKISRGFKKLIMVLGCDHAGYISRLRAAVLALSNDTVSIDFLICQLVGLKDGDLPIKMSKRAGQFVMLQDLIDEVGKDAIRFLMLMRKNDAHMDFDLQHACEQNNNNPIFYVQYAYARCCSVLQLAVEKKLHISMEQVDPPLLLQDPLQRDILRLILWWPEVIKRTAVALEPHRIAYFMIDMASSFHALWTIGKKDLVLRFIDESNLEKTHTSLMLVHAVKTILEIGGEILGVTFPERL